MTEEVMSIHDQASDTCSQCAGRGYVGTDSDLLACPRCNTWCTLCMQRLPTPIGFIWPQHGSLLAGAFYPSYSTGLFRGYACDFHKLCLRHYTYIDCWMVDHTRFWIGTPYIAVQWGRALVELYAIGAADNAKALEPAAMAAVRAQGGDLRQERCYECPPNLGARAVWPAGALPAPAS